MISVGIQYVKLKTNLQLAIKRLNVIKAKKYELCQKTRREIAKNIKDGKYFKAKIRAQGIIREDFNLEAMELVEMFCKQLVDKYYLFESMKDVDESLAEAVTSLIWITSYMQTEIAELKEITKQLTRKYGSSFARSSLKNEKKLVNSDLIDRVRCIRPSSDLVEKYMAEIASAYNVPYDGNDTERSSSESIDVVSDWKFESFKVRDAKELLRSPEDGRARTEYKVYEGYGTVKDGPFSSRRVFEGLNIKRNHKSTKLLSPVNKPETVGFISDITDCETIDSYFDNFGFVLYSDQASDGTTPAASAPKLIPSIESIDESSQPKEYCVINRDKPLDSPTKLKSDEEESSEGDEEARIPISVREPETIQQPNIDKCFERISREEEVDDRPPSYSKIFGAYQTHKTANNPPSQFRSLTGFNSNKSNIKNDEYENESGHKNKNGDIEENAEASDRQNKTISGTTPYQKYKTMKNNPSQASPPAGFEPNKSNHLINKDGNEAGLEIGKRRIEGDAETDDKQRTTSTSDEPVECQDMSKWDFSVDCDSDESIDFKELHERLQRLKEQ